MHKLLRIGTIALLFSILLALLPACRPSSATIGENAFPSLTIGKKDTVTATVTLDEETQQKHKGTRAFLYELKPGDTIKDLRDRDPLDNCKINSEMSFEFSLYDGDHSRLYSSFAVVFNDGSILNVGGFRMIDNPSVLAASTAAFPWEGSVKGVSLGNPDDAMALGAAHGMLQVKLSELANGADTFTFDGNSYAISETTASALVAQVQKASAAGMQVSLTITADIMPPTGYLAALLDHVIARCTQDGANLSAIFVEQTDSVPPSQLATVTRLAYQALISRVENGRVYVLTNKTALLDAMTFFSEIAPLLVANGDISWGAAVKPTQTQNAPWEAPESQELITVTSFDKIKSFLQGSEIASNPSWFAVCGVGFSAENEARQAVSFAYAYRALEADGAALIFYQAIEDDSVGLYAQDGTPRRITSIFSSVDTGLNTADAALCREIIGDAWTAQEHTPTRHTVNGVASVTYNAGGDVLFDFSTSELHGFVGVGGASTPVANADSALGTTALSVQIDPTAARSDGGIRKVFTDPVSLRNTTAITLHLQTLSTAAQAALTLTLDGTNRDGEQITYQSTATVDCNTACDITYHVNAFLSEADLSAPIVLTLTAANGTPVTLEVSEIAIARLARDNSLLFPLVLIPTCVLLTVAILLIVHRKSTAARRKKRMQERAQAKDAQEAAESTPESENQQ